MSTVTIAHEDIPVKENWGIKVAVEIVWDKHEKLLVREIYNGHYRVLQRLGMDTPDGVARAHKVFKRAVAYRIKKYKE